MENYEGATILGIDTHRWYANIKVRLPDGTEDVIVASALVNPGDSHWIGSKDDHDEILKENGLI